MSCVCDSLGGCLEEAVLKSLQTYSENGLDLLNDFATAFL